MRKSIKHVYTLIILSLIILCVLFTACSDDDDKMSSKSSVPNKMATEVNEVRTTEQIETTIASKTTVSETTISETEEQTSKVLKGLRKNYDKLFVVKGIKNLSLFDSPNEDSTIIGTISEYGGGEVLEETNSQWLKVRSGGMEGYVKRTYTFTGKEAENAAENNTVRKVTIIDEVVNIRDAASGDSNIIAYASKGESFEFLDKEGDFYRILFTNETEAYVSKNVSKTGYYLVEAVPVETRTTANEPVASVSETTQAAVETVAVTTAPPETTSPPTTAAPAPQGTNYVANTNTGKFHYSYCGSVSQMKPQNRWDICTTRDYLINLGYEPCKKCNP